MKRYAVVIEKTDGYGAYVPDLSGCIAAGDTLEETERLIHEAIELHVEGMREDGEAYTGTEHGRDICRDRAGSLNRTSA